MPTVVVPKFKRGEQIGGRFTIERRLGEGGCGTVYRCVDAKTEATVAVKVLENPSEDQRFRREARVMARIDHRHVVRLVHEGKHEGVLRYIAMEFVDGGNLRRHLDRSGGSVPVKEAAWIILQAISGLRHAKTVHRDLKPENLLVAKPTGSRGVRFTPGATDGAAVIKVADFGLAKGSVTEDTSLTRSGQVMGTPQYMSPEQCRNTKRVSVKTDIYALGIILYEMTTGRPPFEAGNVYDLMALQCNEEPKLGRVPKDVRDIVGRCLAKAPGKRYPSLKALEDALAPIAGLEPSSTSTARGFPWGWIVAFLLAAGLAYGGWHFRADLVRFWQLYGPTWNPSE